ncbi:MAG: flagellar assembly protein FliW [Campylobacterota bacterium]|nr:flagellar assembly protein FliW [Campylobacterota bacterium]
MLFDLKVPLLGFESIEKMELEKIDDIFMRLKTPDAEEASFTLIDPFILRDYAFDIPTATQTLMDINDESNLLIFNIIVIQNPIEDSVVNFAAPLVFNTDNNTMAQVILSNDPENLVAAPISNFLPTKQDA